MTSRPAEPASTVAAYDAAAGDWERGFGFRSPQFAARMRHVIVRLLQPAAGGRLALELGAGTGWILDATAPLFGELRAIEPSVGMLDILRRRVTSRGLENVRAEAGDATSLEGIDNASVDAIYAIGLLDAVADPARVFAACHRVLKPGGLLVLSTSNGDCPWYAVRDAVFGKAAVRTGRYLTQAELVGYARAAGLREVEVVVWGAAPPSLSLSIALAILDAAEQVSIALGLSRYLGVLTASFRKPHASP